jgi:hypothetical protein
MPRSLVFTALFALALQSSQAQTFSRGIPASVTSPTPDGRQNGVPASVVSPRPLPFGVNPPLRPGIQVRGPFRRFGNPHGGRRTVFVPVPLFYSYYTDGYPAGAVADPYVPQAQPDAPPAQQANAEERNDEDLRAAYLQGARDALRQEESRYGEHYLDSRERASREAPAADPKSNHKSSDEAKTAPQPAPAEDKSPATVFIFKDGRQLETRNYAIMGQTLFDFSGKTLKKIQIEEIDAAATTKANDDRGVQVKLQ